MDLIRVWSCPDAILAGFGLGQYLVQSVCIAPLAVAIHAYKMKDFYSNWDACMGGCKEEVLEVM